MTDPDRTQITRLSEKARTERAELDALLDATRVGHFALVAGAGRPVVIPTAIVRDGDRVLAHGSTGSRWMRMLATGVPTCLAVTLLDGLVVARSAFESSLHYRSAVLFGECSVVGEDEKLAALDVITEGLLPGRRDEIRRPTKRELAATLVLALPITEWSLKVSDGWPEDPPEDIVGDAWAGVVPIVRSYADALPAPDLRHGIAIPPSVHTLTRAPANTGP
ncbi:MAG TPA: pyridoxamine 5'-phosphate oxidase family protein [Jatrophihabitans sp.]|nr:pyridoxamine 5'-phosphate oxidase family protein [Jatrophihabitans sp.]